jgi:predicted acyl esterase
MRKHILLAVAVFIAVTTHAQLMLSPVVDSIPMSDGRKLAADIYIPAGMSQGPVILIQTPYNRQLYRFNLPLQIGLHIDSSKYIIVIADWRGFYGSASAAYVGAPSLGTDGYSCVEWIYQQSWCNGKIGTWGASALGRVQFQTAAKNPPHLTCICPLVAGPQYEYQEYYPNGVLRTEYVEQLDALGFGLKPTLMAHQLHDVVWTYSEKVNFYPDSIRVPCYMIGGWYDHTIPQMLPFFSALQTQSPVSVRSKHRLLMGPWVHGGHGAAQVGSTTQGQLSYPNAAHWSDSLALVYFDYYLRNMNNGWDQSPVVQYYQMGENTWNNSPAWPPAGTASTSFYLHSDGTMDNTAPANSSDSLSYNYDPNDPSPTVGGPTLRSDLQQGPYDQAPAVESRNDILTYTTPVLTQDAVMKGNAIVHLKVSSNRYDTDFDIRLTDVYPDGRSMLVKDGSYRMRYLNGFSASDTAPIMPGQIYNCNISTSAAGITFVAGHRIRVDITSSNYPRFNRNMNNDGVQYPGNSLDSVLNPLIASNTVYTSSTNASYLELPLVNYTPISGITTPLSTTGLLADLFPNPAYNEVTIKLQDNKPGYVYIYDALGKQAITQSLQGVYNHVQLEGLPKGLYYAKIETANGTINKPFVIAR